MSSPGGRPPAPSAFRKHLGVLLQVWSGIGARRERVTPAALTASAVWVVGGLVAVLACLEVGVKGSRPAWGLISAIVAVLIGVLIFEIWRHTGEHFPWPVVHLSFVTAAVSLLTAAEIVSPATVAVSVLTVTVAQAAILGALTPRRWVPLYLVGLCGGIIGILVHRHLQADEIAPLLCVMVVAAGLTAGTARDRLRHHALTDPLTGLPNRGALEMLAAAQIALAKRTSSPLSVVLVDLDDFKAVNHLKGRAEGDRVLRHLAYAWVTTLRATDVLGRHIGDQFVLLLPNCGPEGVAVVVQRMLESTEQRGSCGATGYTVGDDLASMLERCERSMLEAKRIGRGEIVMRSEDVVVESSFSEMTGTGLNPPSG